MKFNVERDLFNEAVSFAVKLLPQRPAQPILNGIRITANGSKVEFATFDYETSAQTEIAAQIETEGSVLVSGRLLSEIASKLPPADVDITEEEDRVILTCGSSKFSLPAMPVDEYPEIPNLEEVSGSIKGADFSKALSQVVMAASKDDVTPVITGVLFEATGDNLSVTATDRYRVAMTNLNWNPINAPETIQALVPGRIVSELAKTFSDSDEIKITLVQDSDRELIGFSDTHKTVTSLLIKGNYPPVKRLFPDTLSHYAVMSSSELIEAVGRVGLVLEREAAIKFTFAGDGTALNGTGQETAEASETVDCHLVGDEVIVSLKPQFLLDGVRATQSEFVRISFTNTENPSKPGPVLITGQTSHEAADDQNYMYLLQPNLLLR